ncbi:hypothetical protein B0H14DRAFT_2574360 [Mycena olivaceomarginata]|nr:hypothetical protein B0H14DRAFT_2574360 [Mycena olivaceomarginata]
MYCIGIADLFAEMVLIREEVRKKMPGNRPFIAEYLDITWPIVIPLTNAGHSSDTGRAYRAGTLNLPKMHLFLTEEINENELSDSDDSMSISIVTDCMDAIL